MNVLITGGAGFIGSHLAERLLADGCNIVAIDDLSRLVHSKTFRISHRIPVFLALSTQSSMSHYSLNKLTAATSYSTSLQPLASS